MGGVRVAAAAADVVVRGRRHRRRRSGRNGRRPGVQGGRADDHQTGIAVRPGTVRSGRRSGAGHGQQQVSGAAQDTSEESRAQVRRPPPTPL